MSPIRIPIYIKNNNKARKHGGLELSSMGKLGYAKLKTTQYTCIKCIFKKKSVLTCYKNEKLQLRSAFISCLQKKQTEM